MARSETPRPDRKLSLEALRRCLRWLTGALSLAALLQGALLGQPGLHCVIIQGLGGMPEYDENFTAWREKLEKVFTGEVSAKILSLDGRSVQRDQMLASFRQTAADLGSTDDLWLFLIGHANHDGRDYRLQIKGPDLTGQDLSDFLATLAPRRVFVVVATSSSGVLLSRLAGPNRVIVTATKNEFERQPPLFLSFFLEASHSAEADTDKNRKVSLLEAFLFADREVAGWFSEQGRLQTEHARLDDQNKTQLENTAESGQIDPAAAGLLSAVAYLSGPPESAYRSEEARQLVGERTAIERTIEDLKFRKNELSTEEYYRQLEGLLVKLASLNERISELEGQP